MSCAGVVDGTGLATWDDLSANNYDLTQGTAGFRPTCQTAAGDLRNGHPTLRFDGSDDLMGYALGASLFSPSSGATIFVVFSPTGASANDGAFLAQDVGAGSNDKWTLAYNIAGGTQDDGVDWHVNDPPAGEFTLNSTTAYTPGSWYTVVVERSGTTHTLYNVHATDGSTTSAIDFPALVVDLTAGFYEVPASGGNGYFQGDIAEMIVYQRGLTDSERNSISRYLCLKWSTTGTC